MVSELNGIVRHRRRLNAQVSTLIFTQLVLIAVMAAYPCRVLTDGGVRPMRLSFSVGADFSPLYLFYSRNVFPGVSLARNVTC